MSSYHYGLSGRVYYAKPEPLVSSPWASDIVVAVENGSTGSFAFNLPDSDLSYVIYLRAGSSPASTDTIEGVFPPDPPPPSFTIVPATANGPKRVTANTIPLFVGERLTTPVPVFDPSGQPISLTGKSLLFKVETQQRASVMSVTPTISGNTFTFTPATQVTESARVLIWSLWDTVTQAIIATGEMPVAYAPQR